MHLAPFTVTPLCLALALSGCAVSSARFTPVGDPGITLGEGERALARFQCVARAPDGVDSVYARAGYLHPIFTPSGAVVTGDYCASHPHQHGVFFAWTRTRFEGRGIDFWNAAERQGVIELMGGSLDEDDSGFEMALAHVDTTTAGARPVVLDEWWHVRASALADATVIDLESTQSAPAAPVEVLQYHYGGFAVRGPEAWEGPDGARAVTSDGHGRRDGDGTDARWVALCGPTGSAGEATIAVLASPENPRAPEPVRIHPSNPYFCFAACRRGPFTIEPGTPRTTRYRIVAMDGAPNVERLEELWQEFAAKSALPASRP